MKIKHVILFFLLLIALPLVSQVTSFTLPAGKNKSTMLFENYDNIVVVKMVLQDSIPIKMILDSGIDGVIITDTVLVKYFEPYCLRSFKLTAPGTDIKLNACITPLMKLDIARLNPLLTNIVLLKDDVIPLESFIGAKVHGLIGMDKFRELMVTINYDNHTLKFNRPKHYVLSSKDEVIPLSIYRGRPYMTARVELDNNEIRDLWLMIDSGANHPLLMETDSADSYRPLRSLNTTIGRGLGGPIPGAFVRSGWLLLGNSRLDNIITSISAEYISGNPTIRNYRHGTLGSGALSRFEVTFDYSNSRLILRRGAKFNTPFEYNMSGIIFESISTGFNLFRVSQVIGNSPAQEAGVMPGDILMSINGKAAFNLNLGELNGLISRKPGTTVVMVLSRNGESLTFRIKLERLI